MSQAPEHPRLRPLEIFPLEHDGQTMFVFRDPEGFSDPAVLPYPAAVLATLMDGARSLAAIQDEFRLQVGQPVALTDVERLLAQLDEHYLLDSPRFRDHWQREFEAYVANPVRPAAHAGGAYPGDPDELRRHLAAHFDPPEGPGQPQLDRVATAAEGRLRGVLSPHIDLHRGGPAFAWAYKKLVEESDADLFVIFGTAHSAMRNLFSVSRKHFDTPLGLVETDDRFVDRLVAHCDEAAADGGTRLALFEDEIAHRNEHSIEFQVLFLRYLLGDSRPFRVVPVLTGSFHSFIATGRQPIESPEVALFCEAIRRAEREHPGKVLYISGGDLAHIGRRFGDAALLDASLLEEQSANDNALLGNACRADLAGFFNHIAEQRDRTRVCGLSPTYTLMRVAEPTHGELLKYAQAVEPDGSSCVSFASVAFYGR